MIESEYDMGDMDNKRSSRSEPSLRSESDVLMDLMIERLHPPREELMRLIAAGYAGNTANAKAATTVDCWLARQDYAISVIKQRLRDAVGI
jgi:hypothetical protein